MAEPNVEELEKKGDVTRLIKALRYDYESTGKLYTEEIRRKAAKALGRLGDKRAIRPMCRLFNDIDVTGVALGAILAILNQLTEENHRKMVKSLQNAFDTSIDREEEEGLAQVLAKIGKPAAEFLFRHAQWPLEHKGEQAALALGKIGDTRAVKPLMKIVDNKYSSPWNVESAARLLAQIGDPQAVKTLGHAMRTVTADYITCTGIAEALAKMGASGLEVLTQALHSRDKWAPLCAAKVLEEVELQRQIPMTDRDRRKFEKLIEELEVGRREVFEDLG